MTQINSKTALVTGGSRGLGKNMALSLAQKGNDVILTYHSNRQKAEDVVAEIESLGQQAIAFQLDTRKVDRFDGFIEKTTSYLEEKTGNPNFDFLINNAGTSLHEPITETTEEQFNQIVDIHFKGVFFLTQ